jgi:hypothetical protein
VQQLPKPPLHHRMWFVVLAVVVVFATAGGFVGFQAQRHEPSPTTAAGASATTEPDWTELKPPATTAAAKPGPRVLWQRTGSDVVYGGLFQAPEKWRIVWSYNCGNFAKFGGGNFKITGDGAFEQVFIDQFGVRAAGVEQVQGGGRGRLVIESVCQRWTVRAVKP